ncbi:hypothetical protein FRC11_012614, partial [Ceratobasidium sp. 423]
MALYIQRLEAIEMHATYLSKVAKTTVLVSRRDIGGPSEPDKGQVEDDGELEDEEWDAWYVVRAQPQRVDQYQRVSRPNRFDTVLLLAYPDRRGIHRYRPGRIRVIFQLPLGIRNIFSEPLAYVELFNSTSDRPVPNVGLFTMTRSLVETQRAALVVRLSAIRMACHLAPKYNTQEVAEALTLKTDALRIFKTFYINIFVTHLFYNLVRHWGQHGMQRWADDEDE